ncbi:nucleotide sugar dehydrogenase [Gammaproteobacteria bacterium]|nr:nucleotide sugar dehydrogenase [Gammaproteobacteria bacterium]
MPRVNITVVGSGYVGMSLAVLLGQYNTVTVLDIDSNRVNMINNKQSTVKDDDIELFLRTRKLSITSTIDKKTAFKKAKFIIVATPTDYDVTSNYFDTSSVDSVIEDALKHNDDALLVIKSTIPLGHVKKLQKKYKTKRIIFSPEFLREGQALKDNLYPARIIVGSKLKASKEFVNLLVDAAENKNIETLFIGSDEAEAVKLFANTYLAMRVSFFNELDSYALAHNLDAESVINGICLDERIGEGYNNPSFGYGGYCLPKDTKQLMANYNGVPQTLIESIVSSNKVRKDFIAENIIKLKPQVVGIHRLIMKHNSDNYRASAILGVMRRIMKEGITFVIYEPTYKEDSFFESKVMTSLNEFKNISDIILTNRMSHELNDVESKVFTRDIFGNN